MIHLWTSSAALRMKLLTVGVIKGSTDSGLIDPKDYEVVNLKSLLWFTHAVNVMF